MNQDIFKSLIFDTLVKIAIEKIIALAPWLSFGPISFVVSTVVTMIANKLYEVLKEVVNLELIILKNDAHQRAFISAAIQLKSVATKYGPDSMEFTEYREKHKKALSDLIRMH